MENEKELSPVAKEIEKLDKNARAVETSISALVIILESILTPPGPEAEENKKEKSLVVVSPLVVTLESINYSLEDSINRISRVAKRIEV